MRGEERLQRGRFLRAERAEKPRDAVRLKTVLQFVRKDDRRLAGCLALQTSDQQARGPDPETAKRDAAFVVQGNGPAAERHGMRVEQCPRLRANVDAEFLRGRGDDPQRFSQLLLGLVAKGAARIPCSLHECRRSISAFLRDTV